MIGVCEIISGDMFGVVDRIREIDGSYFVVRNYKTKKFEVHAENKRGTSLVLVLPFDRLDCRTVDHVRRTRVERVEKLLKEMEEENKRVGRSGCFR